MKTYLAALHLEYQYPALGDPKPPGGASVHLLTVGEVCVRGTWNDSGHYIAWAPLPARNKEKEARLKGIK